MRALSLLQMQPVVAHLVISLAPGGLERLVVDWTSERNRRYPGSTFVCCLDEKGELADLVEGDVFCAAARRERFPFDVGAVLRLRRIIRERGVNVLHSHNITAHQYGVLACAGTRVRHAHTRHGTDLHLKGLTNKLRSMMLSRLTDEVVAVSEATASALARSGGWTGAVHVIPNGVSPHPRHSPEDIEALRVKLGIKLETFVIGSVGRLAQVKGCDRLITTFANLVMGEEGLESPVLRISGSPILLLVGDGPEKAALEKQAKDLGIGDRVIFAGFQREPRMFLNLMSLFVLPSRSEGLSVALLEAMAAGVPVAVTDVGANREVVEDGKCGVLLPDDEMKWARILKSVIEAGNRGSGETERGRNGEMKTRIEPARQRVAERYSLEATLNAYEGIYQSVMTGRAG